LEFDRYSVLPKLEGDALRLVWFYTAQNTKVLM
jgi:hypothetical protein